MWATMSGAKNTKVIKIWWSPYGSYGQNLKKWHKQQFYERYAQVIMGANSWDI